MNVPSNNKFLYFANAVDDVLCMPLSNLISIDHTAGDTVEFSFNDDVNGNTVVQCTTASNAEKEFIQQVVNEINFGNDAMIVVADDDHSVYLSSNVTAVASLSRDVGPRRKVEDVTGGTNVLTAGQSGTIFTVNVASNAATTLTLPLITATNIGTEYEFFVNTENTGGIDILTASIDDTSGDVFYGALTSHTDAAENGAVGYIIAGANDNQINMTGAEANGGGEVGCYVRCVAVSFSSAGHSQWQVTGMIGTDDPNGNMSTIFVNRD